MMNSKNSYRSILLKSLRITAMSVLIPGLVLGPVLGLISCGASRIPADSKGHIGLEEESVQSPQSNIPEPVINAAMLPEPTFQPKVETYTLVVSDVPIKELLFALARDAKINLDIQDDITGNITINAIDQTLPQILDRIASQSKVRYEIEGRNLRVAADTPFLRTYQVEYVNLSRNGSGQIDLATQITATGSGGVGDQGRASTASNNSKLSISNTSDNHFWETLFINILSLLEKPVVNQELLKRLSDENVMINREAGLIVIRATSKQHASIQKLIDSIMTSVKRQVLIEATVVEVALSNGYQAGIDWSRLGRSALDVVGLDYRQQLLGNNLNQPPTFVLDYKNPSSSLGDVSANVRLLEEFGDVKVLSSPKILTLNNQPAVLKVVDNRVYFTVEITTTTTQTIQNTNAETTIHTVPVGLVVGITPFITENSQIILNVRPTISRILKFVKDPNPTLSLARVENLIPEIQVREMESVLQLNNNQVAVIGGLMQNRTDKDTDAVPMLSRIPFIGNMFKHRNDQYEKSELVIFLKAVVINEPSLEGDLKHLKTFLPVPKP